MLFLGVAGIACLLSLLTTGLSLFLIIRMRLLPTLEPLVFTDHGWTLFRADASMHSVRLANGGWMHLDNGQIQGPLELRAKSRSSPSNLDDDSDAVFRIQDDSIQLKAEHGLRVISPSTGRQLFPPDLANFRLPDLRKLSVPSGLKDVRRLRAPLQQPLRIQAQHGLRLQANGGLTADARSIRLQGHSVFVGSLNGSISLDAPSGNLYLRLAGSTVEQQSKHSVDTTDKSTEPQFKLCICAHSGLLFQVQLKDEQTSCADVRFPVSQNPCSII